MLRLSLSGQLLELSLVPTSPPSGVPIPRARSYDESPWEAVPPTSMEGESFDDAPSIAQLDGCSSVWCATMIIETPGYVYRLYTYSEDDDQDGARRLEASDDPPFRRRRASSGSTDASRAKKYAAKLLEQTTFGPTTAEIARLSTGLQQAANGVSGTAREDAYAGVAREWVHEQMQENATSLRAYVRRRSQKRVLPGQNLISGVELPSCALGTRWHRQAISAGDIGQAIRLSLDGTGTLVVIEVNGELRAKVDRSWSTTRYLSGGWPYGVPPLPYGGTCTCPDGSVWLVKARAHTNYHGDPCADGLHCHGGVQGPCAQLNEMTTEYPGADTPAGRQLILDFYSNPNRGYDASDFPHNDFAPYGGNESGYPPGQTAFEHYNGRAMDCTAGLEGNSANFVHEVLLNWNLNGYAPPLNLSDGDFDGFVCQVDERVGGEITLGPIGALAPSRGGQQYGCSGDTKQQVYIFNPPIGFEDGAPPPLLLDVNGDDDATLQRIPPAGDPKEVLRAEYSYEERRTGIADTVLLAGLRVSCELGEKAGSHFLRHRDRYYRRDVRMQTLDNSLERPARRAGADAGRRAQCPATPRTFLNEHSCRREPSCAAHMRTRRSGSLAT